jgi:hypothetical protein
LLLAAALVADVTGVVAVLVVWLLFHVQLWLRATMV